MKKIFVFALLGLSTVMLTGCGSKKQITCTGSIEENGQKVEMKVTATPKDEKITSATATMTFQDEDTAKQMCSLFELANQMNEDEQKLDVLCNTKSLTLENYPLTDDDNEVKEYTEEEFIKLMESQGLTCKK